MVEIFDIEQKKLIINPSVLNIPELKVIMEFYNDPFPAMCYVAYITDPTVRNPYGNLTKEARKDAVLADFPGEYRVTDKILCKAIEKMEQLNYTVINDYYINLRELMSRLGVFAATAVIDDSKEGNLTQLRSMVKEMGTNMKQYREAEKVKLEEERKLKGGKKFAYDQQ